MTQNATALLAVGRMTKIMSETAAARNELAPYCEGIGMDIGFGGDAIVPHAWTMDMPQPYTNVGGNKQMFKGDCRDLGFLCDETLDWLYSSHLIEDFLYPEIREILTEWRRVLKPGGLLITLAPDEKVYSAHCRETGQDYNLAHKNDDFSLKTFREPLAAVGNWEIVKEIPLFNTYSWALVARKV